MPNMASRSGSRRRSMNEINMVPFIDVMLVLLIIFMVTAPMLTPGAIDVPSVGKSNQVAKVHADVIVNKDGSVRFKAGDLDRTIPVQQLGNTAITWLKGQAEDTPILISADKNVSYDTVVQTMRSLQNAGVKRVGLMVKQGGK